MKISKGIGIDLGTTNSCVAVLDITDENILMSQDRNGVQTTPSCVWLDPKTGKTVVGKLAFRRRGGHPEPIISIKRSMGTRCTVRLGDRELTPEEVSAEILKELCRNIAESMTAQLGRDDTQFLVDRAIVTIPAYFGLPAIEATRKAGELAGLEIIELLHEPTAGAVHYAWKHHITEDSTFLVFDPGGGTFDVAIVRLTAGEPEVLGIAGDVFLGGDDLDRRLAEVIRRRLVQEDDEWDLELDPVNDPEDALRLTRLVMLAEGVKKRLTDQPEELLRDQNTLTDRTGSRVAIEMVIGRQEFEEEIRDLIERMVPKCWEALAKAHTKAHITLKDIDHVLMVGGTSYVPLVRHVARVNFCACDDRRRLSEDDIAHILDDVAEEHRDTVRELIGMNESARCAEPVFEDPDTCNARGAAIRAALAGLVVYDDEETVRVAFRGQGATAGERATVAGVVEVSVDGRWQPLRDGVIRAVLADAGIEEEEYLDSRGGFRFRDLPVQFGSVSQYSFQIHDDSGTRLATVGRPIAQNAEVTELGTGVLKSAVLPIAIRAEGLERGRLVRRDLIREMTTLPSSGEFGWRLPENLGYVVIPIYQGDRLIKELRADIDPDLPPGTPITFRISVDAQAYIVCKYRIGEDEFSADIEPPVMDVPAQEEVDQKVAEITEALDYRPKGEQVRFLRRLRQLQKELTEARKNTDEPKLIERFDELCALHTEVRNVESGLEPPKERFDQLVEMCLRLARRLEQANQDRDIREIEKNIRVQQRLGDEAAARKDQDAYGEAFQMLVTYGQGLEGELSGGTGGPDGGTQDPQEELRRVEASCDDLKRFAEAKERALVEAARGQVSPKEAESLTRRTITARQQIERLSACQEQLHRLRAKVSTEPQTVLGECRTVVADLRRSYEILRNLDKRKPSAGQDGHIEF